MKTIEDLKQRAGISIYQHYLPGIQVAKKIICPFHEEDTPSFNIYQSNGECRVHCFGCGFDGDSIDFIAKKENVNNSEAINIFKERVNGNGLREPVKESKSDKKESICKYDVLLDMQRIKEPVKEKDQKFTYSRHHLYDAANPLYMKVIYKNPSDIYKKTARFFHLVDKERNVWAYGKGGESVLYNQNVLAEKPNDIILYSGSEKDIDTLSKLGYLAVTAGSDNDFKEDMSVKFIDRRVCLFSHNDDSGNESTEKISQFILPVAKSVKEADLLTEWAKMFGEDMPKGADITDFVEKHKAKHDLHDLYDLKDVRKIIDEMINNSESVQDEVETMYNDEKLIPIIPFPLQVFPAQFQKFIKEVSVSIHVNTTMVACAVLPIISSAIGNTVRISPKEDWLEPIFIWLIIIEKTGRGKSPLMRILTKHVKRLQSISEKEYREKMNAYDIEMKVRKGKNKDELIKTSIDGIIADSAEMPKRRHYFVQNFTVEALADVFDDDSRGTMICRDELAGYILSLNQYKNKGDDREQILELWDAAEWKNDRKKEKKYLHNTGIGLIGGIQTEKLSEIFTKESFCDGLLPRHLMSLSRNEQPQFSRKTISTDTNDWYTKLLDECYSKEIKFDENNCIESTILKLDEEAIRVFEKFFEEYWKYEKYVSRRLSTFIPKLISYSLRIAGVLHVIECFVNGRTETEIRKETIINAIEITKFFAGQAVEVIKLYDKAEDSLNEIQKALIGVLKKLQGEIKNGRLSFSKIARILNSELPEQLRINDNRIIGSILRKDLELNTTKRGGSHYLIWETNKMQNLFLKIGHVSHTCPIDDTIKQGLFKGNNIVNLENEKVE